MRKFIKLFWIVLIFGVTIKDVKTATVRDLVNGYDPDSQRFERVLEIFQALLKRFFIMYRSSVMANSYYSEYNGLEENSVQFNKESVEDFTFGPPNEHSNSSPRTKTVTEDFVKETKIDKEPKHKDTQSNSSISTTTTNLPPEQQTFVPENDFGIEETTIKMIY